MPEPEQNVPMNNDTVWAKPETKETKPGTVSSAKPQDVWKQWKANPADPASTQSLLKSLSPTIESALTTYASDNKDALRTKATLLSLKAAESYDPAQATQLTTHVYNNLKSLYRLNAERSNIVHIPENVLLDLNKLKKVEADFTSEIGRSPSTMELADKLNVSEKRINYIRNYNHPMADSQLKNEKGDSTFAIRKDPKKVWANYVYHELDPIDQQIFSWSTGHNGTLTIPKQEMAARLKITPAAVSLRISKIMAKLQDNALDGRK